MKQITNRSQLVKLARELGMRPDWHEPDEQQVTAVLGGTPLNFDNAMPPGHKYANGRSELHVVLHRMKPGEGDAQWQLGEPIAAVNLATLFAWAAGYDD